VSNLILNPPGIQPDPKLLTSNPYFPQKLQKDHQKSPPGYLGILRWSVVSEKSFKKGKIDFVEYKIRLPLHPHTKTGQRKRGKRKKIAR